MATVTYIRETRQHLSAMRAVMAYCMREDKTWDEQSGQQLISGINCDGMNSILEFEATKAAHGKTDGINFYQYVQSFKPTENCGARRAFFKPYFLRSFMRGSRVRKPAFFRTERSSPSLYCSRARATP